MSLAGGGLASLSFWLKVDSWERYLPPPVVMPVYLLFHLLTGALLGAAIGKLFHRTREFSFEGALLYILIFVVFLILVL